MACLHIVNCAEAMKRCVRICASGDIVVMIEDAAYCTVGDALPDGVMAYVLDADARARGVQHLLRSSLLTHDDFVDLTVAHETIVSW
ncbi:MAG: DsrH/TusB family sulfur metabolism protein [Pseudomonadales bacterium]|nr:DsrH/TusB family sulfur metabolism protein [Pseudomonadales bacterium]MDP6971957.1 DsrH/TusB family sulfur metabolism protein [Pseudomonadales bacterium]|tara:strand:- start:699 stop:959 length:261 start_codon:yes stop_codon:yes gene_type:complete